MPKVDLSVIGKKNDPVEFEYTWKDVVLYALSVGATAQEFSYVYETRSRWVEGSAELLRDPIPQSLSLCG